MIMRALDGTGDWQFGKGIQSYSFGASAISENIQTRLLSFLNDCFFDRTAGMDWLRLMGSKNTQQELQLRARAMILQSYGVVQLNSMDVNFDRNSRSIFLQYSVDTIYSQTIVNTVEV